MVVTALLFAPPARAQTDCAVMGDLVALVAAATIVTESANAPPQGALRHLARNGLRFDAASLRYALGPAVGSGDMSLLAGFADLMDTSAGLIRSDRTQAALSGLVRNRDMVFRAGAALERIASLCPDLPPLPSILDSSSGWSPQSAAAAGLSALGIILAGGVIIGRLLANRASRNRRYFCNLGVILDIDGTLLQADIVDISRSGAKLTGPVSTIAGLAKFSVQLQTGSIQARPAWSTQHACGVKFQRCLSPKDLSVLLGKQPAVRERHRPRRSGHGAKNENSTPKGAEIFHP